MKSLELLSYFFMLWILLKVIRKGWRIFLTLFFVSLISGCASSSNSFGKSPCVCNFDLLYTSNQGEINA